MGWRGSESVDGDCGYNQIGSNINAMGWSGVGYSYERAT